LLQRRDQVEGLVLVLVLEAVVVNAGNEVSYRNVCVKADAGKQKVADGRREGRSGKDS
jgi:hypothetical protein